MNQCVASFRQRLFIQAAITGIFALLPANADNRSWLAITLVVAAGSAGVAAALGSLGPAAYQTALGWEVLAVAVGGFGITQGTYIPGTIVGIAALIKLLDANVKAAFLAGSTAQPAPQRYAPPQQHAAQFGAPAQQYAAPAPYAAASPVPPPPQPPATPPKDGPPVGLGYR